MPMPFYAYLKKKAKNEVGKRNFISRTVYV